MRVAFEAAEPTDDVQFGLAIHDEAGRLLFGANTSTLGVPVTVEAGPSEIVFELARVPFLDGTYLVTFGAQSRDEGTVYDWLEQRYSFSVMNPSQVSGLVSFPLKAWFEQAT
jgi:hypothetical protein